MTDAPKHRWFRFSLRTLFILVTLCALPFAVGTPLLYVRENRPLLSQLFWPVVLVEGVGAWLYLRRSTDQ
jgi:hypothetical protein